MRISDITPDVLFRAYAARGWKPFSITVAPMTGPAWSTTTPFTAYPPFWANTDTPIMHESTKDAHSVNTLFIKNFVWLVDYLLFVVMDSL